MKGPRELTQIKLQVDSDDEGDGEDEDGEENDAEDKEGEIWQLLLLDWHGPFIIGHLLKNICAEP